MSALPKNNILDYSAIRSKNREVFLLNFGDDFRAFDALLTLLPRIWTRIGHERDKAGKSHAGLLLFANLVQRHALVGFEHVSSFQSYLGWLAFRPGLEALLMVGKFIDDAKNADVWQNRHENLKMYRQAFSGKGLVSRSLPRSAELQQVLSRLNDNFVHANPEFAYAHQSIKPKDDNLELEVGVFDPSPQLHEAHLLAFLNLFDTLVTVSDQVVENLCGPPKCRAPGKSYSDFARSRAIKLANADALAAKVMVELGLWNFGPTGEVADKP